MIDAFSLSHPFVNLFYFVVVLGVTMFVQHPVFLIISFAGALSYDIWLNGAKKVLKFNLCFTLPALTIVALLNPLFNHYGVTTLYYIESSGNEITLEALIYGLVLGIDMFIVIMWFSCYNQVMTSDKFIYIFGRLIPSISLILSMALRFVPRFNAQMNLIRNGQKCSGHDISNGNLLKKVKYGLAMLSILITWALENAIDTADSMKSRGYGLKGRTAYSIYRFDRRDRLTLTWLMVLAVILFTGLHYGAAFAQYDPRILLAGFTVFGYDAPVECPVWLAFLAIASFAAICFTPLSMGIYQYFMLKKAVKSTGQEMSMTYREMFGWLENNGNEEVSISEWTKILEGDET